MTNYTMMRVVVLGACPDNEGIMVIDIMVIDIMQGRFGYLKHLVNRSKYWPGQTLHDGCVVSSIKFEMPSIP